MIEIKINGLDAYIDENDFEIVYVKGYNDGRYSSIPLASEGIFCLKNKKTGAYIHQFKGVTKYIVEEKSDNNIFFFALQMYDNGEGIKPHLVKYSYDKGTDNLRRVTDFDMDYASYDSTFLGDGCFIIADNFKTVIYNDKIKSTNNKSIPFDECYSKRLCEQSEKEFDEETVIVKKEIHLGRLDEYKDVLAFGINPKTLKITTKIHSSLQERDIDLLTKEEAEKVNIRHYDKDYYNVNDIIGSATIYKEIIKPLEIIERQLREDEDICNDSYPCGIDYDEAVRRLKNNNSQK